MANNKRTEIKFEELFSTDDIQYKGLEDGSILVPCVKVRGIVIFPKMTTSIEVSDEDAVYACKKAKEKGTEVFVVTQKERTEVVFPTAKEYFRVGCIGSITEFEELDGGSARVTFFGRARAEIDGDNTVLLGNISVKILEETNMPTTLKVKDEVNISAAKRYYAEMTKLIPHFPKNVREDVKNEQNIPVMIDKMAFSAFVVYLHKQKILEETDVTRRLSLLVEIMLEELEFLYNEMDVHKKVRAKIETNQREYYLREEMKVIEKELGDKDGYSEDIAEYRKKIVSHEI